MFDAPLENLLGAYVILLVAFICFTIIVLLRIYKYITYKQFKTIGCATHICIFIGTFVGVVDFSYRAINNLNGQQSDSLCFALQCMTLISFCTAYNIAFYNWIVIYKAATFSSPRAFKIGIFSTQAMKIICVVISISLYCAQKQQAAGILLVAVGGSTSLAKALGFGIYGVKIIMRLSKGNKMRSDDSKNGDDLVYQITLRTAGLSFVVFAGVIEVILYILFSYGLITMTLAQVFATVYRFFEAGYLLYTVQPKDLRREKSVNLTAVTTIRTSV